MEGHGKAAIRHPTTCMLEGGCTLHGGKASLLLAQVLNKRLRMGGPGGASYYSFSPHARWRVIVLDGYDVSLLGWPPEHPTAPASSADPERAQPQSGMPLLLLVTLHYLTVEGKPPSCLRTSQQDSSMIAILLSRL